MSAAPVDAAVNPHELERDGVRAFCDSYAQLVSCIESKLAVVAAG
jgi:hypothetical protein